MRCARRFLKKIHHRDAEKNRGAGRQGKRQHAGGVTPTLGSRLGVMPGPRVRPSAGPEDEP